MPGDSMTEPRSKHDTLGSLRDRLNALSTRLGNLAYSGRIAAEGDEEMNHTKLPWMAYGTSVITGNDIGPIDARTRDDAAYIVSAANHHEELVKAVTLACTVLGEALIADDDDQRLDSETRFEFKEAQKELIKACIFERRNHCTNYNTPLYRRLTKLLEWVEDNVGIEKGE